ncbi:MAG: MmcQ/YjbR family DNA-binding protein [Lachnospiraceae bacterium]|nr:MmcQ/YjbR family DNA-binding protein [Lachnospiraceae bacterium]
MDRQIVFDYIKRKYKVTAEHPFRARCAGSLRTRCARDTTWRKYMGNAVFRHADNKKWFALVMDVQKDKLGMSGEGLVDVINLKMSDMFYRDMIIREDGIMPAYHMNKMHWISVLLDGTVPEERVFDLIDMSFLATASAKKKEKMRPPKEWIIPSNPKFFDIIHAFDDTDMIDWKQGAGIRKGDTVFLYVGAPVSAVLYKCKVTETDIPYHYQDKNLTITALMKIKLLKRYAPDRFTFDILKRDYGIYAVRGPRGIPNSLSAALEQ